MKTPMRLSLPAAVFLALAGCSALPAQGPSASSVVESQEATEGYPGYLVIDMDQRIASLLASRGTVSLRGRFGDHRPSTEPRIGIGDSVSVVIWEASSGGLFSSPVTSADAPGSRTATIPEQVVSRDGSITVPYAGRVKVAGLTPPAVEARIVQTLSGKAIEPQALVTVGRNVSNTVTVTGEVTNGMRVPLTAHGDRIMDVIASAGGIRVPVHETFVSLTRDGRTVAVPMQTLLDRPSENIYARAGDTLTLVREPQTFTAFGATGRNTLIAFDAKGITLEEAVAKAGGLLETESDPTGVFLLRPEPASFVHEIDPNRPIQPGEDVVNVVYRINMRDLNTFFAARRIPVRNKDMIYVANAPLNEVRKVLQVFQMAVAPATTVKNLSN